MRLYPRPIGESGFAYERSKASSDSEQIEHTVARQHVRNSVSVENERAKSASGSVLVYCERCDKQIQDGIKGDGLTNNEIFRFAQDDYSY